jgi:hypothetical protein
MIKAHFSHVLPRDIRNERGCEEALVENPAELVEYFPQFVGVFLKPAALVLFAIYRRLPAASRSSRPLIFQLALRSPHQTGGRWNDRRAFRICIDFDFDYVLRPFSKAVKSKILFEPGAAEVNCCSIWQAAKLVDELTYGDGGGMGHCLADSIPHRRCSSTALVLTKARWILFHSAPHSSV